MEKQITVSAKKQTLNDGRSFIKMNTKLKDKWYKVSFNKTAGQMPTQSGRYIVTVDTKNIDVQEGKYYIAGDGTRRQENDKIWIKEYISIERVSDEELRAKREKEVLDILF